MLKTYNFCIFEKKIILILHKISKILVAIKQYNSICKGNLYKKGVLKNFAKFTAKHLCWTPGLVNLSPQVCFKKVSITSFHPLI